MNRYFYLPYNSNHPRSNKLAVIPTEMMRLLLTNLREQDFQKQVSFFIFRLLDRGDDIAAVRDVVAKYSWNDKALLLGRRSEGEKKRIVPCKFTYCPALESLRIGSTLRGLQNNVMSEAFNFKYRFVLCWQSAPNRFRERYSRFR